MKKILITLALFAATASVAAVTPTKKEDNCIGKDGKTVVILKKDDDTNALCLVPLGGAGALAPGAGALAGQSVVIAGVGTATWVAVAGSLLLVLVASAGNDSSTPVN